MGEGFRIAGKHVLMMLVGFFSMILTVNMIFLNFALKTFPGEKVEKSYLQGLNYNDRLEARDTQTALGWRASIDEATRHDNQVLLTLTIVQENGAPISALDVSGVLSRPAHDGDDSPFVFSPSGNGQYTASVEAGSGVWDLDGRAVNARNDEFEFRNRIEIP
ncbi:MAG: FixH family protein [Pseudomonadota bacterium]